jgi:hypothetical protein
MSPSLLRVALLAGGLFVGCTCVSVPQPRPGEVDTDLKMATRLQPVPAIYYSWWRKTEECSGLKKRMRVTFYAIPKYHFKADTSKLAYLGLFIADSSARTGEIRERIYLAAPWAYTEWLVRHEMLHSILRDHIPRNSDGHPPEYFVTKCGLMNYMNKSVPTPPPLTIPSPIVPIPDQRIPHLPITPE